MRRSIIYLLIGILFGITMYKSEAASWFRIYEMFEFKSFHMYGIIGSALVLGIIMVQWMKRKKVKSLHGEEIKFNPKELSFSEASFSVWVGLWLVLAQVLCSRF